MENSKYTWIEPENSNKVFLPGYHPIVADRIKKLDLQTEDQIKGFLDPDFYKPSPSRELPGLMDVADQVEKAIRNGQSICVWGDFDVDGQTSTAILLSTLKKIGGIVTYHVPIRGPETHGINLQVLEKVLSDGAQLILTCDTGITAHEAVDYANSRNVEVLITDHHDLPQELPRAAGITNPKFLNRNHPLADLAGVGVAYKLAEELATRFEVDPIGIPVELAALGLVADLALLHGDTRFLVQKGLRSLKSTQIVGLNLLIEASELDHESLTEEQISFTIAPWLNSLGRLSDANMGVELLTTSDVVRVKVILSLIEGLVAESKHRSNQVFGAAEAQIKENPSILEQPVIVLSHPTWPGGILGIVASRLVERYGKPFILLSCPEGEPARGSARSTEGFDIHKAIASHKELLIQLGGHPMAAGLSIIGENINLFNEKLNESIRSKEIEYSIERKLTIDGLLTLDEITLDLVENINLLAPYGPGNEKPVFSINNLSIHDPTRIGRNSDHMKFLVLDDKGNSQTVLWWNAGDQSLPDEKVDLAVNINTNNWKGQKQVQLSFVDSRICKSIVFESTSPKLVVEDKRDIDEPIKIIERLPENSIVWLEGWNKKKLEEKIIISNPEIKITDRNGLFPTKVLALLTTPPSQFVLNQVLESSNPSKIILLKDEEESPDADKVIRHLMGLIKYRIEHHNGTTSITALAAATKQDPKTIRQAISWLEAKGEIQIAVITAEEIILHAGNRKQDKPRLEVLWKDLQHLIEETIAYQAYFRRANKDILFDS